MEERAGQSQQPLATDLGPQAALTRRQRDQVRVERHRFQDLPRLEQPVLPGWDAGRAAPARSPGGIAGSARRGRRSARSGRSRAALASPPWRRRPPGPRHGPGKRARDRLHLAPRGGQGPQRARRRSSRVRGRSWGLRRRRRLAVQWPRPLRAFAISAQDRRRGRDVNRLPGDSGSPFRTGRRRAAGAGVRPERWRSARGSPRAAPRGLDQQRGTDRRRFSGRTRPVARGATLDLPAERLDRLAQPCIAHGNRDHGDPPARAPTRLHDEERTCASGPTAYDSRTVPGSRRGTGPQTGRAGRDTRAPQPPGTRAWTRSARASRRSAISRNLCDAPRQGLWSRSPASSTSCLTRS